MAEESCIAEVIKNTQEEILFAIKEKIRELSNGSDEPFSLKGLAIADERRGRKVSLDYYEINHIYVDDSGTLCGDLVCRHGSFSGDVFFGKSIEYLGINDLNTILDALYKDCTGPCQKANASSTEGGRGFAGFFNRKPAAASRAVRNNL